MFDKIRRQPNEKVVNIFPFCLSKLNFSLRRGEEHGWGWFSSYANTIESIYIKQGCFLSVFDDGSFSNDEFIFGSRISNIAINLGNPPDTYSLSDQIRIKSLENDIRSIKVTCN